MSKSKSIETSRAQQYFDLATKTPYFAGYSFTSLVDAPNLEILKIAELFQKEEKLAQELADDKAVFKYDTFEDVLQLTSQVARLGFRTNLLSAEKLVEIVKLYADTNPSETIVKILRKQSNTPAKYSAYELKVVAALNYLVTIRSLKEKK